MSENLTKSLPVEGEVRSAVDSVRSVASTTLTFVGRVLLVVASVGWLVFWSALARVHFAQGHVAGTVLSVIPILALLGLAVARYGLRR